MSKLARSLAAQRILDRFGYISVGVEEHNPEATLVELEPLGIIASIVGPGSADEFNQQAEFIGSTKRAIDGRTYLRAVCE